MKIKFSVSVYTKLLFLPIITLFFIVIGIYVNFEALNIIKEQNIKFIRQFTIDQSEKIEDWLKQIIKNLDHVSLNDSVRSMEWDKMKDYLINFVKNNESIEFINFSTSTGISNNTLNKNPDISDRDYFKNIIFNDYDYYISDVLISKSTGRPSIVISHQVFNKDKTKKSMLGAIINLAVVSEMIKNIGFNKDGNSYLIDKNGIIISAKNKKLIMKKSENAFNNKNFELYEKSSLPGKSELIIGKYGSKIYSEITNIAGKNWSLILSAEERFFYFEYYIMRGILYLIFTAMWLVFYFTLGKISQDIAIPFESIKNSIDLFSKTKKIESLKNYSKIMEINRLIKEYEELENNLIVSYDLIKNRNTDLIMAKNRLDEAFDYFSLKMTDIIESYHENSGKHAANVSVLSGFISEKLNLDPETVKNIKRYAMIHDIGLISIPQNILTKKDFLKEDEFNMVKNHTLEGAKILSHESLTMARNISLYHHEKYNGKGYPFGLSGEAIPIESAIVSIADTYDALRCEKFYRKGFTHDEAVYRIIHGDNKTSPEDFNPDVLKIFIEYEKEINRLWK